MKSMNNAVARARSGTFPGIRTGALAVVVGLAGSAGAEVTAFDSSVTDDARGRQIPYRVYYDADLSGAQPVILVSHGGNGSLTGYTRGEHLGSTYARYGYLAIHIGHVPSDVAMGQLTDRPADVSFVLDRLEVGTLPLPVDYRGTPNLTRVGHVGHSFGAYTAHAVAGAVFDHGGYLDERIDAICPLSPQGPDQFGAFDNGPDDNTWMDINVPVYTVVGELELNTNVLGTIESPLWRLRPFFRYDYDRARYLSVLPGADHNDLWSEGTPEQDAFVAENTRLFFDIHLRRSLSPTGLIGELEPIEGVVNQRKSADVTGDGRRDIFDILAWFDLFTEGDFQAEATGDYPASLDIFDILAFFRAFARGVPAE